MDAITFRRLAAILALLVLCVASGASLAQNVANGEALYRNFCQVCHGSTPAGGPDRAAGNPALIRAAINGKVPAMGIFIGVLSDAQLADIAAWIASLTAPPPPPPPAPVRDYTDLWYGGETQSGWGLNIIQHPSNVIFAVMYTYDANGDPTWFVLPGGTWTANDKFSGAWYRVTGKPYNQAFAPPDVRAVGTAELTFFNATEGVLTFTVNGTVVTKPMMRQPF
jgi:cytochrome c553